VFSRRRLDCTTSGCVNGVFRAPKSGGTCSIPQHRLIFGHGRHPRTCAGADGNSSRHRVDGDADEWEFAARQLPNADRVPAFLKNNGVEGLLIKTSQYSELPDARSNPLIKNVLRFPLVWLWAKPEGAGGDLCSFNRESAARLAAIYLAEHGHRRVAYFNPKKGKSSLEHMKKEFGYACAQYRLTLSLIESANPRVSVWPESALTSSDDLQPLVDEWLALDEAVRPTAMFVPADNIAVHLYSALAKRSLQVGKDVSIISCNNEKSWRAH